MDPLCAKHREESKKIGRSLGFHNEIYFAVATNIGLRRILFIDPARRDKVLEFWKANEELLLAFRRVRGLYAGADFLQREEEAGRFVFAEELP